VLIGGLSQRMGRDKALIRLGGKPLLEYVLEKLAEIFPEIILIGQNRAGLEKYGQIFPDLVPGLGPVSGIYTALKTLNRPVFVCGCDMPFLSSELIRFQLKVLEDFDAVVPRPGKFYEPLHALYAPACLPAIERLVKSGGKRPVEFFARIRIREIADQELNRLAPDRLSFFNINTREELAQAEKLIKEMLRK